MNRKEYRGRKDYLSRGLAAVFLLGIHAMLIFALVTRFRTARYGDAALALLFLCFATPLLLHFINPKPPFILNGKGIWMQMYGMLPWCAIKGIVPPSMATEHKVVFIIKPTEELNKLPLTAKEKKKFSHVTNLAFALDVQDDYMEIFNWYAEHGV